MIRNWFHRGIVADVNQFAAELDRRVVPKLKGKKAGGGIASCIAVGPRSSSHAGSGSIVSKIHYTIERGALGYCRFAARSSFLPMSSSARFVYSKNPIKSI
jgi:hypothetical protein